MKDGTITYEELRTKMLERFDLSMLDRIFISWNSSWELVSNRTNYSLDNQNASISMELEHDHHIYRSDMEVTHFYQI